MSEEAAVIWTLFELMMTGAEYNTNHLTEYNVYAAIKIQTCYRAHLKRKGFYHAWYRFKLWWKQPCCG